MKKRFLSLLAAVAVLVSLFAFCLQPAFAAGDLTAEEYASMTVEDLLAKAEIADPEKLTLDEYVWLEETYRFVEIDYENMELTDYQSITRQALDQVSSAAPSRDDALPVLLKSEYPQVRGLAYLGISDLFGVPGNLRDAAMEALNTEEDLYCLKCAVRGLSNEMGALPEIADFIFRMSRHENAKIRNESVLALTSSWNASVEGRLERVIEMLRDEDQGVRKTACAYCGSLHDEAVIEPLKEILNNPDEYKIHGDAVRGLSSMWLNYPSHKETCEAAYRATLDYYSAKPRTQDVPAWSGISSFSTVSAKNIGAWYEIATYFDADEFYQVMADFIADPDANWIGKSSAMKAIVALCPEKFPELESVMAGVEDTNVVNSYESLKTQLEGQ